MTQDMKGIIRIVKKNHRSFENMGLIKSIENEANCFALSKTYIIKLMGEIQWKRR